MEPREADFPGGPVVKNPPSNSEDMGLTHSRGTKIPTCLRATELVHCTSEPAGSRARALWQKAPTPQPESPLKTQQRQCSQHNLKKKKEEQGEKKQNLSPKLCHHRDNDQYPCHSHLSPQGMSLASEPLLDCPPRRNCRQKV